MDKRNYNNMGPRLDLGLRPAKPAVPGPEAEPVPYRRQPAPPYHQQNQQANPSPQESHYPGQQAPADPYAQPGTYYDSRQSVRDGQRPDYERQPGWQHNQNLSGTNDMDSQQPYDHEESFSSALGGVLAPAVSAKPGFSRWLWRLIVALALALAALALAVSLTMGRIQNANQATLQMDSELVPGATQERVGKLEKDVSSLLLKMVTLEKDLEAIKNRAWNPTALGEMNNKLTAMQKQIKEMENKLAATRGAAGSAATQAASSSQPAAASNPPAATSGTSAANSNAPVATSQVQERAGDKPDPLATRIAGAGASANAAPPASQPRHTYKVQAGDTLFSIAQRYQVTTKDLMQWNNIAPSDVLKVDKMLVIY